MDLRVCILTTAFPRWPGDGQGAFVWELARALTHRGVQVRVVAMHSPDTRRHEVIEEVEIVRPRYWWPERWEMLRRDGIGGLPVTWEKYPWLRLQLLPFGVVHTLAGAWYARSCDLVHAQWTLSAATAGLGRLVHQRPVVATLHGSDIFQATKLPLVTWLTRRALRSCDRVMAVSKALAKAAASAGVIMEQQVNVVPNGVDVNKFAPAAAAERENIILYVGSFIERKGLGCLLEAMPETLRALPGYRLVLLGEGPQRPLLESAAKTLGIADRLEFVPFLPHDEVRDWMQRAKLLVLPSTEEGMGVVLLEALACGTPVVASAVGGIVEVVSPDVGALVPPADPLTLARAIIEALYDPTNWASLSRAARQRAVSCYAWDHIAEQFIAQYRAALEARRGG